MSELIYLFLNAILISLVSFGGGSQALFYQSFVLQKQLIASNDLSAVLAFGYATPGPAVFGMAAFVGYRVAGIGGALVGALGIFLMPCLLAMAAARFIGHLLENPHAQLFVKGVGLAAAGAVAATAVGVLKPLGIDIGHGIIATLAFVVMVRWKKLNPLVVLAAGALLGLAIR